MKLGVLCSWNWSLLVLGLVLSTSTGCGDSKDKPKDALDHFSTAETMLREAANNPLKLSQAETWINGQIQSASEDEKIRWEGLRQRARTQTGESFLTLSHQLSTEGDLGKINKVLEWVQQKTLSEDASATDELKEKLQSGRRELLRAVLAKDPGNLEIRRELGHVQVALDPRLADEDFLSYNKQVQKDIAQMAVKLERSPDRGEDGKVWLTPDSRDYGTFKSLEEAIAREKAAFDERMKDPFQAAALKVGKLAGDDVIKTLDNTAYKWVIYAHKPYVLIVERDESWNEIRVAEEEIKKLMDLYHHFYGEYRETLGLRDITEPVPVVMFKRANAYANLAKKSNVGTGAAGHFDGATGRLFVSNETGSDTLIHEGTHQLVAYNTQEAHRSFADRSYWFGEGVAEYFGGSHRYLDKDKNWAWELGVLQTGRIDYWRQNQHKAYKLWDLINLTIRDREKNKAKGEEDLNLFVYSQGWFLVYFLNNFNVGPDGMVKINAPGKYRDAWLKFFRMQLEGKGDRDDFLSCIGVMKDGKLDQDAWNKVEEEFNAYFEFVNRKVAMSSAGHVKDRKLIPWDQAVNRRGDKTGEPADDLLYQN